MYFSSFRVWNYEQTEGVDLGIELEEEPEEDRIPGEYGPEDTMSPVEVAASVLQNMGGGPEIEHRTDKVPCYTPALDRITMLPPSSFDCIEQYMLTKLHEYAHSTGHPKRLNRVGFQRMVDGGGQVRHERGFEEMTAELAATLMAAEFGIEVPDLEVNASRYIRSWKLALDPTKKGETFISACQGAQKVSDYILNGGKRIVHLPRTEEIQPEQFVAAD